MKSLARRLKRLEDATREHGDDACISCGQTPAERIYWHIGAHFPECPECGATIFRSPREITNDIRAEQGLPPYRSPA